MINKNPIIIMIITIILIILISRELDYQYSQVLTKLPSLLIVTRILYNLLQSSIKWGFLTVKVFGSVFASVFGTFDPHPPGPKKKHFFMSGSPFIG